MAEVWIVQEPEDVLEPVPFLLPEQFRSVFLCTAHGKGTCLALFPTQRKWQIFGSDNLLSKECLLLKQLFSLPLGSVCVGKSQVKGI